MLAKSIALRRATFFLPPSSSTRQLEGLKRGPVREQVPERPKDEKVLSLRPPLRWALVKSQTTDDRYTWI